MATTLRRFGLLRAGAIFLGFTAYFYLLILLLIPFLRVNLRINPALYWFITGYFLFVPMFVTAILLVRAEGRGTVKGLAASLSVKPMTRRDWLYALGATLLTFALTGLIMGAAQVLARPLEPTPWFMVFAPFAGRERLLLLVWLPMFACNILGEELLWRGYIQTRLERGAHSWLWISLFWFLFHAPFGSDLLMMLLPIMFILPFAFHKTGNTLVAILIHALYNGPTFILVALGLVR